MNIRGRKTIVAVFLLLFFLAGCGGGGGENDNANADNKFISTLKPAIIQSQTSMIIDASVGGSIEHAGATLIIPPNALAETISLSLAATNLPSKNLPENEEILLGRKVISKYGYVIISDKDIVLNKALTLRIPINLSQITEETRESDIDISTDTLGHLIPQSSPSKLNLVEGYVEIELAPDNLFAKTTNRILGRPQGYIVPAALFLAGAFIEIYNTLTVTLNTPNSDTHRKLESAHFNLHFNPVNVSNEDANAILDQLEKAHELFVDGLGFSNRKNLINYDGRYTFVIASLKGGADAPDGYTLPGSSLFEGGSYINLLSVDKQKIVAVHEYFHNMQHGALTSYITPNMGEKGIDLALGKLTSATAQWLFEGSSAALAGRVVIGNSLYPARDPDPKLERIPEFISLYNEPDMKPSPDIAQDFFFFLERRLGHADFYLPTFQALRRDPLDTQERAVRALDEALVDITNGTYDIELAWDEFIKDYWIDNNNLYNIRTDQPIFGDVENYFTIKGVKPDGRKNTAYLQLKPLTYALIRFVVPALNKDQNGNIDLGQRTDLVIESSLTNDIGHGTLAVEFVDELAPSSSIQESTTIVASDSTPKKYTFTDFRRESKRTLYAVISNSDSSSETINDLTKHLSISAHLGEVPDSDATWKSATPCPGISEQNYAQKWSVSLQQNASGVTGNIYFHACPGEGRVSYTLSGPVSEDGVVYNLSGTKSGGRGVLYSTSPYSQTFVLTKGQAPVPNFASSGGAANAQDMTSDLCPESMFNGSIYNPEYYSYVGFSVSSEGTRSVASCGYVSTGGGLIRSSSLIITWNSLPSLTGNSYCSLGNQDPIFWSEADRSASSQLRAVSVHWQGDFYDKETIEEIVRQFLSKLVDQNIGAKCPE